MTHSTQDWENTCFEQPIVQICPPEAFVNERLAPARVVSQCQGFGSPFGLFASIGKQTNLQKGGKCYSVMVLRSLLGNRLQRVILWRTDSVRRR